MSDKELALEIIKLIGGQENIASVRHCATRLRIVVNDKDKIETKAVENLDKVKGSFFNSGQYQIILGTGLVNRVYDEVVKVVGEPEQSTEKKEGRPVYGNKFQRAIRMFSDVFVPIIPVLVATGLFMGLRGLLTQEAILGIFGLAPSDIPQSLLTFTQILTDTAFAFLPALVCWSTFRNFGGSPVIGIVLGLMLVNPALPNGYAVGSGEAQPLVFLGFIKVAGYQGSVLPAFVTGIITAKFEQWLRKHIPDSIDLIVTPFVTMLVGIVLALFGIGPVLHYVEMGVLWVVKSLLMLPLGIDGMSENFHSLYRKHLMPKRFAYKERPVLLNSWESMYYDVSLEKIDIQSDIAKRLGIELFVLDDGWFRKGNDSRSSMGDWICNENKLKGGIKAVSDLIHSKGMQFGLWFEPEAVSKDSRLYTEHPDWILHIPGYEPTEGRHEYLLDLTRREVRNYIVSVLEHYLGSCGIDYVKWDMNRPLTDINSAALGKSQKGETAHRYILGLYDIIGRITESFPDVLFEGCSSGGARFDPGILYYFPQNWTSDNTDAFDRVQIQSGYSMLYPPIAMGAHVSITPNHQTGRTVSLKTRQDAAGMFNFGYELDLTKMSDDELKEMEDYISKYKSDRHFLTNAEFRRHDVPDDNYTVWSMTSADKKQCVIMIFQKLYNPLSTHVSFRINCLDEDLDYKEETSGKLYGGDELKYCGISIPAVKEDFHTFIYNFKAV